LGQYTTTKIQAESTTPNKGGNNGAKPPNVGKQKMWRYADGMLEGGFVLPMQIMFMPQRECLKLA
jgi:hypothetical protein